MRPVTVIWRDAFDASDKWVHAGADPDIPVIVTSVGWLLDDHLAGYTVIASSMMMRDGAAIYGGVQYIPDGMVVDIAGGE